MSIQKPLPFQERKPSKSNAKQRNAPKSPSKRRNNPQTDLSSPPKIQCAGVNSPVASSKLETRVDPISDAAFSPKTPSSYLRNLTLESPVESKIEKELLSNNSLSSESVDLLSIARSALHTHTGTDLPGREEEKEKLRSFVHKHMESGTSSSLYVSGPPGTGKTACLTQVLEEPDIHKGCRIVTINCTAVSSPNSIFSKIANQLKLTKKENSSLEAIRKYLQRRHKTVLMVFDEMDQLDTQNQSVLYTLFEFPATYTTGIIVIGIANALDLTDRLLPRLKANCKLSPELLHFAPYTRDQLLAILHYRLKERGATDVFMPSALQLLASKQAALYGDARRALDSARRLVEKERCRTPKGVTTKANVALELDVQPLPIFDSQFDSPSKNSRSSPRKPMTPVSAVPQVSDHFEIKSLSSRSLVKCFKSPTQGPNFAHKENTSPTKSKSARKLDFQEDKDKQVVKTPLKFDSTTAKPKAIDVKSVMLMHKDVYGTSQTLGSCDDKTSEELPIQHKFALCSLLLILQKGKNKDVTLGKHHDVYRKVCSKRHIAPLDQGAFLSMLELMESRGILHLQSRGKAGVGRLIRVRFQWVEDEVISALQDRDLLASILSDVACLS